MPPHITTKKRSDHIQGRPLFAVYSVFGSLFYRQELFQYAQGVALKDLFDLVITEVSAVQFRLQQREAGIVVQLKRTKEPSPLSAGSSETDKIAERKIEPI